MVNNLLLSTLFVFAILGSAVHAENLIDVSKKTTDKNAKIRLEYDLQPNLPEEFTNIAFWRVTGYCTVSSAVYENPMHFKVLNRKGSMNGVEFSAGESLDFIAHAGERFELSAEPSARVTLTNMGAATIKMTCSTTN